VRVDEFMTWGTVITAMTMAFVCGAAPVFAVRCISRIYPAGDPRRAEVVAEMAHVAGRAGLLRRWVWLGEQFAIAVYEGPAARRAERSGSSIVDAYGVRAATVVTIAIGGVAIGLLPFSGSLEERVHAWCLWTAVAGFGFGLLCIEAFRRRIRPLQPRAGHPRSR